MIGDGSVEWVSQNLAVISGVLVPLLLAVVGPILERDGGGRDLKRIKRYAQLRSMLVDGSEAASDIDSLLAAETGALLDRNMPRVGREIDGGNIFAIFCVSLLGGAASFGLVTWAQHTVGFWSGVLWFVFAGWTVIILLLVLIGGSSSFYKKKTTEEK